MCVSSTGHCFVSVVCACMRRACVVRYGRNSVVRVLFFCCGKFSLFLAPTPISYSASAAFAAVKADGSVVTWGYVDGGGDSRAVREGLSCCVTAIYSTQGAFAALRTDGRLITWGSQTFGGDSRNVAREISSDVSEVYTALAAFAVKKTDGSVVSWGYPEYGGDSSYVKALLKDVRTISANSLYNSGHVKIAKPLPKSQSPHSVSNRRY